MFYSNASFAVVHCYYFIDRLAQPSRNLRPGMSFIHRNVFIGKGEQSRDKKALGAPPCLPDEWQDSGCGSTLSSHTRLFALLTLLTIYVTGWQAVAETCHT